jgi:site-specific DNA recombinase
VVKVPTIIARRAFDAVQRAIVARNPRTTPPRMTAGGPSY